MKYRMVVSDFDDTLVRSDGSMGGVSQFTKDTISEFMANGGLFTISTGRSMGSLLLQLDAVGLSGLDVPLMSLNGGYSIKGKSREVIREVPVCRETALAVCAECEKREVNFQFYDKDYAYVGVMRKANKEYIDYTKTPAAVVGSISQYVSKNNVDCMKMLILESPEKIAGIKEEFSSLFPDLIFLQSHPLLLEIINKDSGKGNALAYAASLYGIPLSEVMAIGDNMNDLSMIRAAGLGVAVGNAEKEIKQAAGYVSDKCEEDGVAKAIRAFCL